jgi:hypothetical protein
MSPSRALLCGTLTLLLACNDVPSSDIVVPAVPQLAISDAVNDGNEHFFWLPPIVKQPESFNGAFDGSLLSSLQVQVCEWTGSACATPMLATFNSTTGTGSEVLRSDPMAEAYLVNWHTKDFNLDPTKTYRILVLASGVELGFADVDVVATGSELRNHNTGDDIPLKDGRTLVIQFRVEEDALARWSGHLYAHSHFGGGSHPRGIAIYDISDISSIQRVHEVPNVLGWSVAVHRSGVVYVGRNRGGTPSAGGLDVYGSDLNLVRQITIPTSDAGGITTVLEMLAIGPSGLLFVCNSARAPQARIFVFDIITDPTNPVLLNIEDIPGPVGSSGNVCTSPTFDSNGDVWVSGTDHGGGGVTRMAFDAAGYLDPNNWDSYPVGGQQIAIEPATDRLFLSPTNFNFIKIVEASDRATVVANIQNICDNTTWSTGQLLFTDAGDLVVGCSNYADVPTDLVVFPSASLVGLSGTVNAWDLVPSPIRYSDPLIWGAGGLALAP